jgi:hypothetical protein
MQLAKYFVEFGSILPKGPIYSFNAATGGGLRLVAVAILVKWRTEESSLEVWRLA